MTPAVSQMHTQLLQPQRPLPMLSKQATMHPTLHHTTLQQTPKHTMHHCISAAKPPFPQQHQHSSINTPSLPPPPSNAPPCTTVVRGGDPVGNDYQQDCRTSMTLKPCHNVRTQTTNQYDSPASGSHSNSHSDGHCHRCSHSHSNSRGCSDTVAEQHP
jgi:hypothetical protein